MNTVGLIGLIAMVACTRLTATSLPVAPRRPSSLTFLMAGVVGACLIAQVVWPTLLIDFRRDRDAVGAGELYRIVTSLFVQDEGLVGGLFNVAMLLIVGTAAEALMTRRRWLFLYLAGGVLTELVALDWQPIGAGNSIASMSLAGAVLVIAYLERPGRLPPPAMVAGLAVAVFLCLRLDIHGAAVILGALLGLLTRAASRLKEKEGGIV